MTRHHARRALCLIALIGVTGCSTAAQRQAQQAAAVMSNASADLKACTGGILAKPEYASLLQHTPDQSTGQFTMAQLTDEQIPTPQDARLFAARHDDIGPCRSHLLNVLSTARPDLVPVFVGLLTNGNLTAVEVVERKITWGESARRAQTAIAEFQTNLAAANRQWAADLNASHQAELAHRQAATNALMQWSQQQQMIDALNRPVVVAPSRAVQTTCNRMGSFVNCTSY